MRLQLLLGSVSASALTSGTGGGLGGTGPVGGSTSFDVEVILNRDLMAAGYTLSNDDKTLENTDGTSGYLYYVPTVSPIPATGKWYWEIHCLSTGGAEYLGYFAVVPEEVINSGNGPLDYSNPVYGGSLGYRGNGDIWGNNSSQLVTGLPTYGENDIIMLAFEPSTGSFWTGKNGVWNQNPETDSPVAVSISSGSTFYAVVQGRGYFEGGTIVSNTEVTYPVPSNCQALKATYYRTETMTFSSASSYIEFGKGDEIAFYQYECFIETGNKENITFMESQIFVEYLT